MVLYIGVPINREITYNWWTKACTELIIDDKSLRSPSSWSSQLTQIWRMSEKLQAIYPTFYGHVCPIFKQLTEQNKTKQNKSRASSYQKPYHAYGTHRKVTITKILCPQISKWGCRVQNRPFEMRVMVKIDSS